VTRQKWLKFENDQLPGQTWSNLVKHGQAWSEKDGQNFMVKKTWSVHTQKICQAVESRKQRTTENTFNLTAHAATTMMILLLLLLSTCDFVKSK
jgi:hypothetical protein